MKFLIQIFIFMDLDLLQTKLQQFLKKCTCVNTLDKHGLYLKENFYFKIEFFTKLPLDMCAFCKNYCNLVCNKSLPFVIRFYPLFSLS